MKIQKCLIYQNCSKKRREGTWGADCSAISACTPTMPWQKSIKSENSPRIAFINREIEEEVFRQPDEPRSRSATRWFPNQLDFFSGKYGKFDLFTMIFLPRQTFSRDAARWYLVNNRACRFYRPLLVKIEIRKILLLWHNLKFIPEIGFLEFCLRLYTTFFKKFDELEGV